MYKLKQMSCDYFFAYGTLQTEFNIPLRHQITNMLEAVGKAYFLGRLFEIDKYPAAILDNTHCYKIHGQVFKVKNKEVWTLMDEYEECSAEFPEPHEYERKIIEIYTETGDKINAWAYLYKYNTKSRYEIKTGNYLQFHTDSLTTE